MSIADSSIDEGSRPEGAKPGVPAQTQSRLRTRETFDFVANAPVERAFPLFGAKMERVWAEDWDPQFVWPVNAEDREGMVFQIAHGDLTATWINTAFDPAAGRIQYVYVLTDFMATVITLGLTPRGNSTHVSVVYERTSLSTRANAKVGQRAEHDRRSGPEWAAQINRYLAETDHGQARSSAQ
jgi:hypothetical protein